MRRSFPVTFGLLKEFLTRYDLSAATQEVKAQTEVERQREDFSR
jgi:hypothetical protein